MNNKRSDKYVLDNFEVNYPYGGGIGGIPSMGAPLRN